MPTEKPTDDAGNEHGTAQPDDDALVIDADVIDADGLVIDDLGDFLADDPAEPDDAIDDDASAASDTRRLTAEQAMIERARKRYGSLGAVFAGGMLGLDKFLGRKVKPEAPVEWEAAGEPLDIEGKGITVPIDDGASAYSRPARVAAGGSGPRRVTRRRRG